MSSVAGVETVQNVPDCAAVTITPPTPDPFPKMVAPILRVEALREGEKSTCSSGVGSDTDGHLTDGPLSHGEASDVDSGDGNRGLGEFVEPDEELIDKIIKQVEFYFSDSNILKDAFLLKHVRRNKLGYVSLKLITSFKKVKSLTKDYRVTAFSLRRSEKLEVNEEGTKVRRNTPLPDYDETTPSRTVVAVNLPLEAPSIENVAEIFAHCGEIGLIRILRPGKTIPQDVKKHINKHPEIGTTTCAVVEFENHEAAQKACDMTNRDDWRGGMRVVMLSIKKQKKDKDELTPKSGNDHDGPSDEADDQPDKKEKKVRKKVKNRRKNSRVDEIRDVESPCSSGSEMENSDASPGRNNWRRSNNLSPRPDGLSPGSSARSSPNVSPRQSPRSSPNMRRRNTHGRSPLAKDEPPSKSPEGRSNSRLGDSGGEGSVNSSPSSPWVQRRLKAQETSPLAGRSPGASPMLGRRNPDGSPRMANMEGVMRQPRGPDGTRGFGGRGRGVTIVQEESKQRSDTV